MCFNFVSLLQFRFPSKFIWLHIISFMVGCELVMILRIGDLGIYGCLRISDLGKKMMDVILQGLILMMIKTSLRT